MLRVLVSQTGHLTDSEGTYSSHIRPWTVCSSSVVSRLPDVK